MASRWSDLGLPTPNSSDYAIGYRVGLYRTPFPTFKPGQARQFAGRNRTFTLTVDLDRTQLKIAEDYLRATGYRGFSLELLTDEGRLVETEIRLVDPYKVAPSGYRTHTLFMVAETVAAFWASETQVIEDAERSTLYTSNEWPLSTAIPQGSRLVVISGEVRYQPANSSSWTQWVSSNLIVAGGGKIQVRQTSSDEYLAPTAAEVRIAGVPWVLSITTKEPPTAVIAQAVRKAIVYAPVQRSEFGRLARKAIVYAPVQRSEFGRLARKAILYVVVTQKPE